MLLVSLLSSMKITWALFTRFEEGLLEEEEDEEEEELSLLLEREVF